MGPQMEVPAGHCGDRVSVEEPCGFMCGQFPPNTILLRVKVECDGDSREEVGIWCVPGDDAVGVVELHVPEAELGGAAVRICLRIFA